AHTSETALRHTALRWVHNSSALVSFFPSDDVTRISAFHSRGPVYRGTLVHMTEEKGSVEVERIQTGVRMEKRLLKVLKAVAELKDLTLGDLLEGIVLHAFEGKTPFSPQTLKEIEQFKSIYGMTLSATDSHKLQEKG